MKIDLTELKAPVTAAAANRHDALALNDYGMTVPPTTVLDLIAEIEIHRLLDTKGCKPDLNTQPFNGINSEHVLRLAASIDSLNPHAGAQASNACSKKNEQKGSAEVKHARALLNEIRSKNEVGVTYA